MKNLYGLILIVLLGFYVGTNLAEQCGKQAGGAVCPNGNCCSEYGYCGDKPEYCGTGCQSQCKPTGSTPTPSNPNPTPTPTPTPSGNGGDLGSLISASLFEEMLKHRNDQACKASGFYTYDSFITAAKSFGDFGTTGDDATRKKEISAFFAQTSHETTGGWPTAPDGAYAWGYCHVRQENQEDICDPNQAPCPAGKQYYGRGPIQLTHNYNYQLAGKALNLDLINDPDMVATNPVVSFQTALWFWMTPNANKPSSHDVIIGKWTPSDADKAAGRVPGFGVITNIINGGIECGMGPKDEVADRIGFFKRYCDLFGASPGDNLDCYNQKNFNVS